jgi:hypothetical protein
VGGYIGWEKRELCHASTRDYQDHDVDGQNLSRNGLKYIQDGQVLAE